jgi:hypothetical protein
VNVANRVAAPPLPPPRLELTRPRQARPHRQRPVRSRLLRRAGEPTTSILKATSRVSGPLLQHPPLRATELCDDRWALVPAHERQWNLPPLLFRAQHPDGDRHRKQRRQPDRNREGHKHRSHPEALTNLKVAPGALAILCCALSFPHVRSHSVLALMPIK